MGAGVPSLLRRSRGSTAVALVVACWFAGPADAVSLPADVPAAPESVASAPPLPTPDLTPAAAPLQATAGDASSSVERVVAAAADTLAGGAEPAVDAAMHAAPVASAPPATPRTHAAPGGPPARAARRESRPPAEPRGRGDRHVGGPAESLKASAQALVSPPRGAPAAAASPSTAGSADTVPEAPSGLDPLSGGSVSGASPSLLLGGLAVLLTALLLAGPALRRRLPSRPALCWPAAFVPLLERPG